MIKAVMVMNTQGKSRLAKFYEYLDSRLVYKHFATLYFVFVFDSSENELAVLDLIQGVLESVITVVLPPNLVKFTSGFFKVESSIASVCHAFPLKTRQLDITIIADFYFKYWIILLTLDVLPSVFVETLDKCFQNVCELDIVFNYSKVVSSLISASI
ncbi:hypothetical protein Goshw_027336 [Gossypium schwendimanii]|uniref:AP complex subunit sigma n=1 Tax=Gossypium schwendimanii TaxID=34291 RepID=A0A7J9LZ05_GOSSC|nr:hypothetical protein [Gossypium schwendimanii]